MMRPLRDPWDGRDPDRVAQRRRLLILIAGAVLILVVLPFLERRQTASDTLPAPSEAISHPTCRSEDEIPVETLEDGYRWEKGDVGCVHVDVLFPLTQVTPMEVS